MEHCKSKVLQTVVLVAAIGSATCAVAQFDRYGDLANASFSENRPTTETSKLLKDELLFQRATPTYLWALPLINTLRTFQPTSQQQISGR
jgi:hypothetical protein